MYWPDIAYLKRFYDSQLGQIAQDDIGRAISEIWQDLKESHVMGLGYATPYLEQFRCNNNRVTCTMPVYGGVTRWPSDAKNLTCVAEEVELPFGDNTVDNLLVVHTLEHCHETTLLMREIWRILKPEGRVLLVVPNRKGIWSHMETNPFSQGHPFSSNQLRMLLESAMFVPVAERKRLFFLPVHSRFTYKTHKLFENSFGKLMPNYGGVLLIDAKKQLYAPTNGVEVKGKLKQAWATGSA